jgi:large subunit ribosomal protein L31
MKKGIHPELNSSGIVCTTCGTHWNITSTRTGMRVDICSNCHPFYTGEQRIVDTAGQVDRFMRRLASTQNKQADRAARNKAKEEPAQKKSLLKEIYGEDA